MIPETMGYTALILYEMVRVISEPIKEINILQIVYNSSAFLWGPLVVWGS